MQFGSFIYTLVYASHLEFNDWKWIEFRTIVLLMLIIFLVLLVLLSVSLLMLIVLSLLLFIHWPFADWSVWLSIGIHLCVIKMEKCNGISTSITSVVFNAMNEFWNRILMLTQHLLRINKILPKNVFSKQFYRSEKWNPIKGRNYLNIWMGRILDSL